MDASPLGRRQVTIEIYGQLVDGQTRCVHYHSALDVVAIQFKCCQRYYACHDCHSESESHAAIRWTTADVRQQALLCGVCKNTLTIAEYLNGDFACTSCHSPFNPGCATHRDLYFAFLTGSAR